MAKPTKDRAVAHCPVCGVEFGVIRSILKRNGNPCCSRACGLARRSVTQSGNGNPAWCGGRVVDPRTGYVYLWVGNRKYKLEHRVVIERQLGRPLGKHEHVHHINGIKGDNRPENLQVVTAREHLSIHAQTRTYWGRGGFDCCTNCGTSEIPHKSRGLCRRCYEAGRVRDWAEDYQRRKQRGTR